MALNISPVTILPEPPTKTNPEDFAQKADAFVDALTGFGTDINAAITELNKITSGLDQTTPIAAHNMGSTYNFPDVVAGSNGATYRCVTTACVGIDPTLDNGANWYNLSGREGQSMHNYGNISVDTTIDVKAADVFTLNLTSAVTISFSGWPNGRHKTVMLVITGGGFVTWDSSIKWPDGKAPDITTGRVRLVFANEDAGSNIDGGLCGVNYA